MDVFLHADILFAGIVCTGCRESEMGLLVIRAIGIIMSITQNKKESEVCLSVRHQNVHALYSLWRAQHDLILYVLMQALVQVPKYIFFIDALPIIQREQSF